jgi:hypothetical protein
VLVAHLNGNAPQVSVEIGRGNVPSDMQPSFFELEEALKEGNVDHIASECADVGNFAMMIWNRQQAGK